MYGRSKELRCGVSTDVYLADSVGVGFETFFELHCLPQLGDRRWPEGDLLASGAAEMLVDDAPQVFQLFHLDVFCILAQDLRSTDVIDRLKAIYIMIHVQ